MNDDCRHGQEHYHHHHHHIGVAEGMTPQHIRKLQMVIVLAIIYFFVQLLGGFFSGSLALIAEAGHKLADIGSLALALLAAWFAHLSSSPQKTFGYYRLEILAALLNATALIIIAGLILYEAWERLSSGQKVEVEGGIMLGISIVGLLINLGSAFILYPARDLSLNVKGALFHVLADTVSSIGTMLTGLGIMLFHVAWLDSIISALIAALVLYNASRLLREALSILMETAPKRLNVHHIQEFIRNQPGVTDVHDLHVWTITTGKDALLAHVQVSDEAFHHETTRSIEKILRETYDLCHITIQLEPPDFKEEAILF